MRFDLKQSLLTKHPKILGDTSLNIGDGWYTIVDQLCKHIQEYIDWTNSSGVWATKNNRAKRNVEQVTAEQIKEKFGGLRFYYSGGDDKIDGMVTITEAMSIYICEQCGNAGRPTGTYWIKTLCNKCKEE